MTNEEPDTTAEDEASDEPEIRKDPASDPGPPENPEIDDEKMREALDGKSKELW